MKNGIKWIKVTSTCINTTSYVAIKQTQAFVGWAVVDHACESEPRDPSWTPAANHVAARSSLCFRWSWLNAYRDFNIPQQAGAFASEFTVSLPDDFESFGVDICLLLCPGLTTVLLELRTVIFEDYMYTERTMVRLSLCIGAYRNEHQFTKVFIDVCSYSQGNVTRTTQSSQIWPRTFSYIHNRSLPKTR